MTNEYKSSAEKELYLARLDLRRSEKRYRRAVERIMDILNEDIIEGMDEPKLRSK